MANPLITNFDTRKLFIGDNRYKTADYTNSSGSTVTLTKGMLLGRIFASNKVKPHAASATDGSEYPVGILSGDYSVADGATVTVTFCCGGDVAKELVTLGGSDTFATVVTRTYTDSASNTVAIAHGTIEDLITARTHINLVSATDLTGNDNQ